MRDDNITTDHTSKQKGLHLNAKGTEYHHIH